MTNWSPRGPRDSKKGIAEGESLRIPRDFKKGIIRGLGIPGDSKSRIIGTLGLVIPILGTHRVQMNYFFESDFSQASSGWRVDSLIIMHTMVDDTLFNSKTSETPWSTVSSGNEAWVKIPSTDSIWGNDTKWLRSQVNEENHYDNNADLSVLSPIIDLDSGFLILENKY